MGVDRRWLAFAAAAGGLLAWSNLVVPLLPSGPGIRAAANVGATGLLLLGVRAAGLAWAELGAGRWTWRRGARWGGAALAAGAAVYLVVLAVPAGRELLVDRSGGGAGSGELLARAFVLIPLGVVLCEEIAFRGVLLALARRRLPDPAAVAVTAAVFGLWHVSTAMGDVPTEASVPSAGASVLGTVVVTGLGGVLLAWLRLRSGSLLAPAGLHLATNSLGLLATAAARAVA